MITEDMIPAMQGVVPPYLATCSAEGIPNTTFISQAFYVDETHLALSFQFFNKTTRNVRSNPKANLRVYHPETMDSWDMEIEYDHSENDTELFDQMDMQLEAIASMTGMAGVFKLLSADVYTVLSVRKNTHLKN